MQLRCPHCQGSVEVETVGQSPDAICPLCGGEIKDAGELVEPGESTQSHHPRPLAELVSAETESFGTVDIADDDTDDATPGHDWQPGERISDRWEVQRVLKGGMGIVYVLYNHESGEAMAAKTFEHTGFARDPAVRQRFVREARAWIALDKHENVTRAHFVEKLSGRLLLYLEYVAGGDLSKWIAAGRLTEDLPQVLRFGIQFCDGMTHALAKGIQAHRDIKPANCLLTPDNVLKVTDFGLAKAFIDDSQGDTSGTRASGASRSPPKDRSGLYSKALSLFSAVAPISRWNRSGATQTGVAAGTRAYMAPEQFDDFKRVDVSGDIYSFGVMLFEMATGRRPFSGRRFEDYRRAHQSQGVPLLSSSSAVLNDVLQCCLAKDPAKRFTDFGILRHELADLYCRLTGQHARQPATPDELDGRQWYFKGRSLLTLDRWEDALRCLDRFLAQVSAGYRAPQEVIADTWHGKGSILASLNRHEEALACCERALELDPGIANAWSAKGSYLAAEQRHEEALACYERALAIDPRSHTNWANKGCSLMKLGRGEDALACFDRALEFDDGTDDAVRITKGAHPLDPTAVKVNSRSGTWFNKGACYARMGRYQDALGCMRKAAKLGHQGAAQAIPEIKKTLRSPQGAHDPHDQNWDAAVDELIKLAFVELASGHREAHLTLLAEAYRRARLDRQHLMIECAIIQLWSPPGLSLTHPDRISTAAFTSDSNIVATAGFDRGVLLVDCTTGKQLAEPLLHDAAVWGVVFAPDCRTLLSATHRNTAHLWDVQSGQPLGAPLQHDGPLSAMAFSADSRTVVTTGATMTMHWDAHTSRLLRHGKALKPPAIAARACVDDAILSPDGWILCEVEDVWTTGRLVFWDVERRTRLWESELIDASCFYQTGKLVAFSPDSRLVLFSKGNEGHLCDVRTGRRLGAPLEHINNILAIAFSPDGRMLLTGDEDGTAQLWDVETCRPLGEPLKSESSREDQPIAIRSLAFSPDNRIVITGGDNGIARLWDVREQKFLGAYTHDCPIESVYVRPDRCAVLLLGGRTARVWRIPLPERRAWDREHLRIWARAETGIEVSERGEFRLLSEAERLKAREKFERQTGSKPRARNAHG